MALRNYGIEVMSAEITRPHRSRKQRVFLIGNLVLAFATVMSGSGLLYANWKLNNRNVVSIDSVDKSDGNINLPEGDLTAKNFLITGSDNNACIAKDSPYAGGFGKRAYYGERSDSIMVIRVNPIDNQAAVLSFPRDMWVTQAGTTRKGRININFDTGYLSREEGVGLTALLAAVQPSLLSAAGSSQGALAGPTPSSISGAEEEEERCEWRARPA